MKSIINYYEAYDEDNRCKEEGKLKMDLEIKSLTEKDAKEICKWKYEAEYSIYNYPDWETVVNQKWGIAVVDKRNSEFIAIIDEKENLCGYIRFVDKENYILVGLGLKPSLCGNGIGNMFMKILKDECMRRYRGKKIVLEVRIFNKRAIKCYERAGFIETQVYKKDTPIGSGEFIRMEY